MPRREQSPGCGGPGPCTYHDHGQEVETILAEASAEPWVLEERRRIHEAHVVKAAWLSALGLTVRDRRDDYLVACAVAAVDRMLRQAA